MCKRTEKIETESYTKIIWFDEDGNPIWTETYEKLWDLNLLSWEDSVSREINQSSSHCVTKQTTNCYTK